MFERFEEGARRVVVLAQENATRLEHHAIGTQHLLLGMYDHPGAVSAQVLIDHGLDRATLESAVRDAPGDGDLGELDAEALATVGIDLDAVRERVEATFGPGALDRPAAKGKRRKRVSGHIPFTPSANKALELALREAQRLGHPSIDDSHLLLGVIRDRGSSASRMISDAGVDTEQLRTDLESRIPPGRAAAG